MSDPLVRRSALPAPADTGATTAAPAVAAAAAPSAASSAAPASAPGPDLPAARAAATPATPRAPTLPRLRRALAALNPRRSLRARFALMIGGAGLAFALLAALAVHGVQRRQLIDTQGQAMRREALLLSRSLNMALQERLQQLRQTAAQSIVASGLAEPGDLRLLLEALREQQPALAWLAYCDPRGRVLVATNALLQGSSVAESTWFAQALQRPWIGERHPAGPLERHLGLTAAGQAPALIDLAAPVIGFEGQTLGVLVARVRWDWLEAQHAAMRSAGRRMEGSDTLVLDRDGRVLLGPQALLDQRLDEQLLPGLGALRQGRPGVLRWPDGSQQLTALGLDDDSDSGASAGLTVLLRQPVALALADADALRWRLVLLGSAAAGLFMLLSAWLAGRVARPVQGLSDAAARVAAGEPPAFVDFTPRRQDEVAELARALQGLHQELARRLQAQQATAARLQTLFDAAPVAIAVLHAGRIQLANRFCQQLLGASPGLALDGQPLARWVHPQDQARLAEFLQALDAASDSDAPAPVHLRLQRDDGGRREVELRATPLTLTRDDDRPDLPAALAAPDGPAAPGTRPTGEARLGDAPAGTAAGEPATVSPPAGSARAARRVQLALRDITDERHALDLLRQREAQLQQTSRMARVGGWSYDLRSGRVDWTDEMARIYERSPADPPDVDTTLAYFHGADRQALQDAVRRAVVDGQPYDLELQITPPSGHRRWVRAQGQAVREGGRTVQLTGITQDITERRLAQEAVRELNAGLELRVADRTARLQAANAELDSFAYAVSHDLRAPLRAISGFAQALVEDAEGQLDPVSAGHLDQIIRASRRMAELIDGLLALSRSSRAAMTQDRVDLSALAQQVLADLQRAEPQRQVATEVQPGLVAHGDRRLLDVVLRNLLGNAWKYTARQPQARIRVSRELDGGRLWFVVADNGAGFDMAHAGRLFKPFARLHRADEFPGIGIGLATVQRIVQRHGGILEAQGQPGVGAVFRFTLSVSPQGSERSDWPAGPEHAP